MWPSGCAVAALTPSGSRPRSGNIAMQVLARRTAYLAVSFFGISGLMHPKQCRYSSDRSSSHRPCALESRFRLCFESVAALMMALPRGPGVPASLTQRILCPHKAVDDWSPHPVASSSISHPSNPIMGMMPRCLRQMSDSSKDSSNRPAEQTYTSAQAPVAFAQPFN